MLPFSINLRRGESAYAQILTAVHDALASGQLRDGDAFPSARVLSQELRISPATAQRVVATLRQDGFLAEQRGSGLTVRRADPAALSQMATVVDERVHRTPAPFPGLMPPESPDAIGMIDGYAVKRLIARGGMGMVFEAEDRTLRRRVAIKVLTPQSSASAEARTRFLREARAAAAADHENVLPIHAAGESGGCLYLVMPLVNGESLQTRLHRDGPLPLGELREVALKVAKGLAAAHERGLVHRDIKPDNILVETGPGKRVWIADFGLARALDDGDLTRSGVMAGTPRFCSPEQAEGLRVDHRTDLFSFGSLLYAMATGSAPFQADTALALLRKIVEETPRPPREKRPDLPAALEDLVLHLLEKAPEKRPASAAEVVERIEAIR